MAKYYGTIGFVDTVEVSPGVWQEQEIATRPYHGEILKFNRRYTNGESINDNITVGNRVSILGDTFACENIDKMRWIEWMNSKWIVSEVEIEYPRLILSLGGLYNG